MFQAPHFAASRDPGFSPTMLSLARWQPVPNPIHQQMQVWRLLFRHLDHFEPR